MNKTMLCSLCMAHKFKHIVVAAAAATTVNRTAAVAVVVPYKNFLFNISFEVFDVHNIKCKHCFSPFIRIGFISGVCIELNMLAISYMLTMFRYDRFGLIKMYTRSN